MRISDQCSFGCFPQHLWRIYHKIGECIQIFGFNFALNPTRSTLLIKKKLVTEFLPLPGPNLLLILMTQHKHNLKPACYLLIIASALCIYSSLI